MQPRTQSGSNEAPSTWPGAYLELPWSGKPRQKLTGLLNQGGTCYLNTLLQTLLHTPEFTFRLFNLTKSVKKEHLKRMIQEMLNLFLALITTGGGAISSKPLTDSFGWTEDEVCVHQDIQELNRLLFEQIEIALKGTCETNLINDLYRGIQCTRIRCLRCGRISERNDEFQDINLSVMDHDSVEASLAAHTQLERLTGDNQYFCESCQCKVDAVKVTRFEELPPILTLSLSRFYFDAKHMQSVKLEKMCSFPLILDMSNFFVNKTNKKVKYNLFSVVLHVGGSTGGGHYHAFIKDPYGTVRETSKDSASASEFNANNKWREPVPPMVTETNDSIMESQCLGLDVKITKPDDDIPFVDEDQVIKTSPNSYQASPNCKKPGENNCRLDYTSMYQTLQTSPKWVPLQSGNEYRSRSRISETPNWKPPPGGFNRLHSPLLFSESDRAGDHETRYNPTSKAADLRGSVDCTSDSIQTISPRKHAPSDASSISEIVDGMKNSLSIDSSVELVELEQKTPCQRGKHVSVRNAVRKGSYCKSKRTSYSHPKHLAPIIYAQSNHAAKRVPYYGRPIDAISIYPIKCASPSRVGEYRSRSVNSTGYGQHRKEFTKHVRKKIKESVPFPKPHPNHLATSYRNEPKRTAHRIVNRHNKQYCVPSHVFPSVQTSQHNSNPRDSTPSTTSRSQSPTCRRAHEPRINAPIPDFIASRSIWHSRQFDGSTCDERACPKHTLLNSTNPTPHSDDSSRDSFTQIPRDLIHANQTLLSDDSSYHHGHSSRLQPSATQDPMELEDTLDSVPAMQRTNAQYPSRRSQSREADFGSSRLTSHMLTCGKSVDYSSFFDRNSFNQTETAVHLNTEEEQEMEEAEEKVEEREIEEEVKKEQDIRLDKVRVEEHLGNSTMASGQSSHSSSRIKDSQTTEDNSEVVVGRWFDFNDDCIMEVDPSTFSRVFEGPECAYMLFYRRTNLPDPIIQQSK